MLTEDSKIFIDGKISDRSDSEDPIPKVIAGNIYSLKNIRSNLARTINIKVPYTAQDPKILNTIKSIAQTHKGNLSSVLYLEDSNQRLEKIRFGDIRMSGDDYCLKELREKLHDCIVRIGI